MAEDGEPRWSRTTVVAVAAGCGAVVVAALVPIVALLLAPTIAYAGTRLGIELVNQAADATSGQAPTGSEAMIDQRHPG